MSIGIFVSIGLCQCDQIQRLVPLIKGVNEVDDMIHCLED